MAIDFDRFLEWAENRFGDVIISGNEIRINSVFRVADQEHKLYCNPDGGVNGVDLGVYHCWKSGKYGTLAGLVMLVDGCGFEEALDTLNGRISFADLYQRVEEFFDQRSQEDTEDILPDLSLPSDSYLIASLPSGNPFRQRAEQHLEARKIPVDGLYVCAYGKYRDRIVIPYYDRDNKLIYFNCRALHEDQDPKYRGPEKEIGIGKGDVIYVPKWPEEPTEIFVTEGEFDSKAIVLSGLYAAALGGKEISLQQISYLHGLIPIMAFDSDTPGRGAIVSIGEKFINLGIRCFYVCPPIGFKDWNELYIRHGADVLRQYLQKNKKRYTEHTKLQFMEQII